MQEQIYSAVILAAGQGRRAGGYKPLWPFGDGLVIDSCITAATGACSRIIVVGGSRFELLKSHLSCTHPGVELVLNSNWELGGMFSSIQLGLLQTEGPVFVQPADMPGITADIYMNLADVYNRTPAPVVKPVHDKRGGHPVLLGPEPVEDVRSSTGDVTLRDILRKYETLPVQFDTDLITADIDTKEQYEQLLARGICTKGPRG